MHRDSLFFVPLSYVLRAFSFYHCSHILRSLVHRKLNKNSFTTHSKTTHNSQMNTVIVFASLELIELLEDGERVPTKVAQKQQSYHLDSYTKDWYEDKKKALETFGLSQYLISNLLQVALSATMETISYSRAAALYSLRRQKTTTLTDKEVDNILHILF